MTHASVFSGIGGAELAAYCMGWQNLFHCEIQEFPRRILEYWFPNSVSYEDITKTDFSQWRGKVDILTGGFPCQPFSVAGRRRGTEDDRYLWPYMLRTIREVQPTWVVAENVAGITSMVVPGEEVEMGRTDSLFEENYIYREESEYVLNRIWTDFESEGYCVQPVVIPACAVGAPHRRDRIWIIANRSDTRTENMQQKRKNDFLSDESSSNSNNVRQRQWQNEQISIGEFFGTSNLGVSCQTETLAHSQRNRGYKVFEKNKSEESNGNGFDGKGNEWNFGTNRHQNRWQDFPSQSPIFSRHDGVPFDVDDLAISFAKWRKESIKAYGNAWVPQVAYEIFRAIQQIEMQL